MGLFNKSSCALCGGKTGLLDKKCIDGKVCKSCREKLSVWFDNYSGSYAENLKTQIEQKDKDAEQCTAFNFNKILGDRGVILIDEKAKLFTAFADTSSGLFGNQRKVTSIADVQDLRPDLIFFKEVEDIDIDITETTREEKRTVDGKQESYDPPRFTYMESFTLRIHLKDHPYIRSMYIPLNEGTVQIKHIGRRATTDFGHKLSAWLLDMPQLIVENQPAVYNNDSLIDLFYHSPYEMPESSYGFKCTLENWDDIRKYQYYLYMAQEIRKTILG